MSLRYRGTLLCEDVETERLIRPILERRFGRGRFRVERPPRPQSDGAGDAWVLARYPQQAKIARRLHQEAVGLVVVIDGDGLGRERRLRALDDRLADALGRRRGSDEKNAILVPTRSIETWEYWLCGEHALNEQSPYKDDAAFRRSVRAGTVSSRQAVEAWFKPLSPDDAEEERKTVPTLAAARVELKERLR